MKRPIAEIRRDSGVTQKRAATELGIAQSTWSVHERRETAPRRQSFDRSAMLTAVKRAASAMGSGIQLHIEDVGA